MGGNNTDLFIKSILSKSFWLYFFTYLAAPAGYITRVLLSNTLDTSDLGVLYSIIGFFSILSMYNGLGLTESLKFFLPKYISNNQHSEAKSIMIGSVITQIITSIAIIITIHFGLEYLSIYYFKSLSSGIILQYFLVYFLCTNIIQIFSSVALSFQDTFSLQFVSFLRSWLIAGFVIFYFFLGTYNLINYSKSFIFGIVIVTLITVYIFFKKYYSYFSIGKITRNSKNIYHYVTYSGWTFLAMNAGLLITQIDQQMVIYLLGAELAGIYANYFSLINLSFIFISPVVGLIFPIISDLYSKSNFEKISILQQSLYSYLGVFCIYLMGFLIPLGGEIAGILYGVKFMELGNLMYLGGVNILLQTVIYINYSILAGLGQAKNRTYIILIVGPLNVLLNFILSQYSGLNGIIISTILCNILMIFFSTYYVKKVITIKFNIRLVVENAIYIGLLGSLLYLFKDIILNNNDLYRFKNLIYLLYIFILYSALFILYNLKTIQKVWSIYRVKSVNL